MTERRAQAHTLEAIIAALLLLSSIVFALQITAVTPLSASTSNQHIENQQQATAQGILAMSIEQEQLQQSILYWNVSGERFHNATVNGYYTQTMPTEFGRTLERAFGDRGIAYNVYLSYYTASSDLARTRMIYRGEPSDNAVSASRSIVLTNDTQLLTRDLTPAGPINSTDFYAPNIGTGGYYNTIRVEVIVWRI